MFKKSNVGDQLLIAVKLNKISEISRLVALGVDVDSRIDKNGKTALQYAAYKGQLLAVKALIEAGADLDLTDENGVTALHRAIIHGHTDVVCTLLAAGCSVDKIDENGNAALHEAAWNGYSKCVELLVAAKCSINMHNRTGYTSLHLAAQNCHCTTVKVLLDGGSNPLAKNNYGDTPLHLAVRYGHVEVCNILTETKINVSEQNNEGNTPLHIAASMGHEKLTEMLLEAGSDTTEKNNVGDTARDLAVRNRFKKIARLLAPSRGDTLKMFRRKERGVKPRPYSADVSNFFSGTTDSTLTTNATHLWIPKPASLDPDSKKQDHKRDFTSHLPWGRKRKDERKPKVLTIKYEEMCSIERDYIKKRNETRKSHKSRSKSSLKSQEERVRSDPVLHQKQRKFHSLVKVDEKMKSAQSRDDLEVTLTPKKNKKEKGLFALFRSASDTELNADEQKNGFPGKKHKDKYPLPGEAMGNGVHHVSKEVREKGDIEETKEKKEKRKSDEKTEKKDRTGKKSREEEKEKKERRKEKEKEKKQSRRDEKDGSESDCTICQEKRRKSREKAHSKESKHKESRSKSEHRRTKDHKDGELKDKYEKTHVDKKDEGKEHKKKKHHRDKEKEKEHKEREKEHRDKEREKEHKEREKDKSRRDKNHKRKTEEHGEDFPPMPCNQTHCSTCQAQLSRLEAWQERCTSEIDSARRRLEHRLQRLEKRLEEQLSEERQSKEKETREYDRVVDRVTDECREVSKNVKDSSGNVKEEIRGLIKGGLSKLELKLGQISAGYNIPFMENQARCNPELGKNCSAERRIRHVRSRSSPHLGRAPCEDCLHVMEHRAGGASPHLASFSGSGTSSRATSGIRVSDSGSLDTVIEARPVGDKGLYASGTIIEARPIDDEGLDTVIEAQHVVEDENVKINETYAATQVQHQKQIQEVEKWWRAKAEEEQRVLYARICELEQMLMMSRPGGDCFV